MALVSISGCHWSYPTSAFGRVAGGIAHNWRIFYRIDHNAILVAGVFARTTQKTPRSEIDTCMARLKRYDDRKP
ncbi:MAG: transposase [Planctomycetota bacterium]|nr:transposase [Planctomycetota bacterium]